MANGLAANIGFGDLLHADRRLHARVDARALEPLLQGERVHDGCEHADVIGLRTVHALGSASEPAEDVAASHRDGELDAAVDDLRDLRGYLADDLGIDAVALLALQRLARKLEQDALVLVIAHMTPFSELGRY